MSPHEQIEKSESQLSQKLSEYRKTKEQMDYALSELDKKESELTAKKDEILSKQSENRFLKLPRYLILFG